MRMRWAATLRPGDLHDRDARYNSIAQHRKGTALLSPAMSFEELREAGFTFGFAHMARSDETALRMSPESARI